MDTQNFNANDPATPADDNLDTSNSIAPVPIVSLDEGLRRAHESGQFTQGQMREMRQACTALKKAVGKDGQSIPLNPRELRPLLLSAMRFGFCAGRKRRSNVKSAIVTLAIVAGVHAPRDVIEAPLSADWEVLRSKLHGEPVYHRMKLGRLMAFCAHRGIAPQAVDDATIVNFENHLVGETLLLSVREVVRLSVKTWNCYVGRVEGWPARIIKRPDHRDTYSFPLESFSPSFQEDFKRFVAFLRKPDHRERRPGGLVAAPGTQRYYRELLIKAASILVRSGVPISDVAGLKDLVVPERVDQILEFIDARFGNELNSQSQNMAQALSVVARRYVKVEPNVQAELAEFARNSRMPPRGLSERNRRRLQPFSSPLMLAKLAALPARLMTRAKKLLLDDPDRAVQIAAAAAGIELGMTCLLRLRTLTEIELTDFIVDGKGRITGIFISNTKTKTRNPIDAVFGPTTCDLLQTYKTVFRPLRPGAVGNWFFTNRHGQRISAKNLSDNIARTIESELRVRCNVHLFRHIAATIVLEADPRNLADLKMMLSHSDAKVTDRLYGSRNTSGSLRRFGQILHDAARPQIDLLKGKNPPPSGRKR